MASQLSLQAHSPAKEGVYQPRGINAVQLLFKKHFQNLADRYEEKHATIYGRFRIKRITEVVEKFILCGDYSEGIAESNAPILNADSSISVRSRVNAFTSVRPARRNEHFCFLST